MHDETRVLILPGLGDSGQEHWQSQWERSIPGCERVVQTEWNTPRRDDWVACLDAALLGVRQPVVLVAHSSACALVAHWACQATPARHARVRGALLVAPSDPEGKAYPAGPVGFAPVPLVPLPFPTIVVGSTDDPYVSSARASEYAEAWGGRYVELRDAGHINVASGHGPWPEGVALLQQLLDTPLRDDGLPPWLETEDALEAFLAAFRRGAFPIAWWTHGAHVAMAATILWSTPVPRALNEIRDAIRHYNVMQGGQNTATSGYHETLTRLWIGLIASTLAALPPGGGRLAAARYAYQAFARRSSFFRDWYDYDLLKSTEARRQWVPPAGERASWFGSVL